MNTTPELVARRLDADSLGIPRNFITPAIVADAMRAQPGRFGYLVCDFPTAGQQSLIHTLAVARRAMRSVDGFPCPEPQLAEGEYDQLYRDAASQGFRGMIDAWNGFTLAGHVMAAGVDFGKFWRLDDPRPILASAVEG